MATLTGTAVFFSSAPFSAAALPPPAAGVQDAGVPDPAVPDAAVPDPAADPGREAPLVFLARATSPATEPPRLRVAGPGSSRAASRRAASPAARRTAAPIDPSTI